MKSMSCRRRSFRRLFLAIAAILTLIIPETPAAGINSVAPNDPEFFQQWGHEQITDIDTDILTAWEMIQTKQSLEPVVVAVIDHDIGLNHPDLENRVVPGCDIAKAYESFGMDIFPEQCAPPTDRFPWHGLVTGGVIAAESNNSLDIAGVAGPAPVYLMPLRLSPPLLMSEETYSLEIAAAIRFAANQGARIINFSICSFNLKPNNRQIMEDAILYAETKGALVVAAAGNNGMLNGDCFPANSEKPNVIGVASINPLGQLAVAWNDRESEFQDHTNYGLYAHIAAPGTLIESTWGTYGELYELLYQDSGTSFAAPYVSGIAALALSMFPQLTADDLRQALMLGVKQTQELSTIVCFCNQTPHNREICFEENPCEEADILLQTPLVQAGGYISAPKVLESAAEIVGEAMDLNGVPLSYYPKAAFQVYFREGVELNYIARVGQGLRLEAGHQITLSATETDPSFDYDWDLGDGTVAEGEVVNHVYEGAGVYNVVLTVTNSSSGLRDMTPPLKATVHDRKGDFVRIMHSVRNEEVAAGYIMSGGFTTYKDWFGNRRVQGEGSVLGPDGMRINLNLKTYFPVFRYIYRRYALWGRGIPTRVDAKFSRGGVYYDKTTKTITVSIPPYEFTVVNGN